jgi:hypothetical protein
MGAGTVGGQTAVPDAWLEKVARMFELFLDPNGTGINEAFQRNLIKTLSGDAGTYHAGLPTIQRVARGAGADYTPNFLTDAGVISWNLTNLFDTHVQNDMVWYLNSTGDGYGDGDIDAQEVIEHVFHTLHMHGLPADDIKLYQFLAADWQTGDLYAAMEEAYDAGKWDPSGYQSPADAWKTNSDAFEVAAKEYLFLLNFAMFEYTELWDGGSLAPEWTDDMRTQAGIQANNPLGYAFHNTYIAPVISKPSLATIRSIFQDGNTPAQDDPTLAGASGYVVDVISSGEGAGAGDIIVVRKSTSDGTFLPDPISYDSVIQGGALNYSTATGVAASDINIDGDGFVTQLTSKGPEELVPGQILDTLDIQVYERPTGGASQIYATNYVGDGTTVRFKLGNKPVLESSVFAKVDYVIQDASAYTLDLTTDEVVFTTAPALGNRITLITVDVSGASILDVDEFIGDGSTTQFLTSVPYESNLEFYATVNGKRVESNLSEAPNTYEYPGNALLNFGEAPTADAPVRFAIFRGLTLADSTVLQNFSEVNIETITADGTSTVYDLSTTPFTSEPSAFDIIVEVNNKILNPGYSKTFKTQQGVLEYKLDLWQIPVASVSSAEVYVFLGDQRLQDGRDFTFIGSDVFDSSIDAESQDANIIRLKNELETNGKDLRVFVLSDGEYSLGYLDSSINAWVETPNQLRLVNPPAENEIIKVYQFSNNSKQKIERLNYEVVNRTVLTVGSEAWYKSRHLTNGLIKLDTPALDAQYVWVSINGDFLNPSVDYYVTDNRNYVKIIANIADNDVIDVIHFAGDKTVDKFGWRQFKDMLNRNHYKRLDGTQDIILSTDLNITDNVIYVNDASSLSEPSRDAKYPGVIFINGERIEYFVKEGNELQQIRRGTLGTGANKLVRQGTEVYPQSANTNLPYSDKALTTVLTADGTSLSYTLDFTANSVNDFEVFVAGKRLRKTAIEYYQRETYNLDGTLATPLLAQDSPEGDITLPAEFTVSGDTLTLTEAPGVNQKIIIVRRQGKLWSDPGTPLSGADSDIARFLRAKQVDLPR